MGLRARQTPHRPTAEALGPQTKSRGPVFSRAEIRSRRSETLWYVENRTTLKQQISVVFLFLSVFLCFSLEKQAKNMISTENENREKTEKKQEQLALPRAVVPGTQGATSLLVAGHSEGMSRMDVARLKLRKAHWTASKAVRPQTLRTNTGLTTIAGQRCVGRRGGLVTGTRESLRGDIKRLRPPCVPRATLRHSESVGTLSGV